MLEVFSSAIQGARGLQMHYNQSNSVDGIRFGIMGTLIALMF